MTSFGLYPSSTLAFPSLLAMGPVYARGLQFLAGWISLTLLLGLGAWLGLRRWQPAAAGPPRGRGDRAWQFLLAPVNLPRDWIWLVPVGIALLLATDYVGFTQGFFRWDDFSFVQVARDGLPLARQMSLYHNDHSLPLLRLWIAGVVTWAGPDATAGTLARAFNLVNFLTCLGVLLAGAALLADFGVKRLAAIGFMFFAWCWPGWGEFTTGFYTLIVYPQTLVCGLIAILLLGRYRRRGGRGWLAGGLLALLIAGGLDISGIWVVVAAAGFAWAGPADPPASGRRLWPWLLLALVVMAYYHLVWFHHPRIGRELVQNPRGQDVNHSLLLNLTTHPAVLPAAVISGLGGGLLNEVLPGFLGLTAPWLEGHRRWELAIRAAEFLALAAAAGVSWRLGRRLAPPDRRRLLACLLPAVVLIGLVALARGHSLKVPGTLWPTKYFCVPQVWGVLAAAFLLDRLFPAAATRAAAWTAGAFLAGAWLVATHWALEQALDIPAARRPAGRQGNTAAALARRADFFALQADFEELARRTGEHRLSIPPPLGLYWAHPYLEFGYDPVLGGTYLFTDLLAVAPASGVTLREVPAADVPAATQRAMAGLPHLQRVFDPTPP